MAKPFCDVGTKIQTYIVPKTVARTSKRAGSIVLRKGGSVKKIDETDDSFRFRQAPPTHFKPGTFRTISVGSGVLAVIGCPMNNPGGSKEASVLKHVKRYQVYRLKGGKHVKMRRAAFDDLEKASKLAEDEARRNPYTEHFVRDTFSGDEVRSFKFHPVEAAAKRLEEGKESYQAVRARAIRQTKASPEWQKITPEQRRKVLSFLDDPLYAAVFAARNKEQMQKALNTLFSIRSISSIPHMKRVMGLES